MKYLGYDQVWILSGEHINLGDQTPIELVANGSRHRQLLTEKFSMLRCQVLIRIKLKEPKFLSNELAKIIFAHAKQTKHNDDHLINQHGKALHLDQ
jgi:hypothetical protein